MLLTYSITTVINKVVIGLSKDNTMGIGKVTLLALLIVVAISAVGIGFFPDSKDVALGFALVGLAAAIILVLAVALHSLKRP